MRMPANILPLRESPPGAALRDPEDTMFCLVAGASFVEITSPLYTDNLITFFADDAEVVQWLRARWLDDELRHGELLRDYVQRRWPAFDWETSYKSFLADYGALCTVEKLAPSRALEMVARCVIETGTATFYRMLSAAAQDPELKALAARISADEVHHYKNFYRFFRRYRAIEKPGRAEILCMLWHRLRAVRDEDSLCALKAVHLGRGGAPMSDSAYTALGEALLFDLRRHFPCDMAAKMYIKPLDLPPLLGRAAAGTLGSAVRLML
jgi:hypothetical protein